MTYLLAIIIPFCKRHWRVIGVVAFTIFATLSLVFWAQHRIASIRTERRDRAIQAHDDLQNARLGEADTHANVSENILAERKITQKQIKSVEAKRTASARTLQERKKLYYETIKNPVDDHARSNIDERERQLRTDLEKLYPSDAGSPY